MQIATSYRGLVSSLFVKITEYVTSNFAYLKQDPSFFLMKYLARFCFFRGRVAVDHISAETLPKNLESSDLSLDHSLSDAIDQLNRDGYYSGFRLSQENINTLLDFAYSHPCYANRDPNHEIRVQSLDYSDLCLEPKIKYASYLHNQESCPVVQRLKEDPLILSIAQQYLGRHPVYMHSDLLWSFPQPVNKRERLAAAQVFHCDINDYRSLKFFFYLTTVSEQDGAHIYIQGTHRHRYFIDQLLGQRLASKADDKIIQNYGKDKIITVTGSSGLGFVGDPYCIHRGSTLVGHRNRLLLQIEFGLFKYNTYYNHKILKAA